MPFIVEQVQSDGSIVEDYDQTISVKKLYERIQRYFPEIYHDENGMICGKYQEKIFFHPRQECLLSGKSASGF